MNGNDLKLIGFGGALALGGLWLMKSDRAKIRRCSARTLGRVVQVETSHHRESDKGHTRTDYTPIVEYVVNGRTFGPVRGGVYTTSKRKYVVGNSIEIRYNPNKPEEFLLKGGASFVLGLVVLLLGGLLIFFGINEMAVK